VRREGTKFLAQAECGKAFALILLSSNMVGGEERGEEEI
jgi:hypothetical protein